MLNTEILALHLDKEVSTVELKQQETCFLCGRSIEGSGVLKSNVISSKFTNFSECKKISSKYCCEDCANVLKNADLRKNNFVADKSNLYLLKKNDLENYLFDLDKYVKDEFVVGITTSFKKHNSFRCRVNNNTSRFFIRQEDKEFMFDVKEMKALYDMLNEAYLNFSKEELLKGEYSFIALEEFGIDKFMRFEDVFKQHRKTHQFELLIYMLNSERRNEYIKEKIKKKKEKKKNG